MKARYIILALAVLAAYACNKEAALIDPAEQQQIAITATIEGSDDTRTSLKDGGTQVFWEYGDNIKVFYDGQSGLFDPNLERDDLGKLFSTLTFYGTLDNVSVGTDGSTGKKIFGLYPYRDDATSDGSTVTTTLPDEQIGMPGSFFKRTHITASCSSSVALRFYNVTGGVRFKVSQSGIKKVILEGNNGNEKLAGTAKISFSGNTPSIKNVTNAASAISLTAPKGDSFKAGEWYYIVALPCSLPKGFKLTFIKDGVSGVYSTSSSVSITRGKFANLENLDANLTFSEDNTIAMLPEIKSGDDVLATNPLVEKFLTEVKYPENDYSYTRLLDYSPVAPGQSDIPPTYILRWEPDASAGELEAVLVDGDWSQTWTLPAGSSYKTVTNLRPNAEYKFVVSSKDGSSELAMIPFSTHGHLHQCFFSKNVHNCRDLGGWKTKDGKTVKYRKVYRGGRLQWDVPHPGWTEEATLDDNGIVDVLAEGIKAQLELRNTEDALSETALGAGYAFCAPLIKEGYSDMLKPERGLTEKTRQCFEFIVQCIREDKPVYFHCSLGRDRTGTMAMIVLGVLGVDEGDISQDYELTQFAPHYWGTSDGEHTLMTRTANYAYKSAAGYIWETFAKNGETFATGMEKFLLSIGVSQTDIDDFRSLMLE